MTHEQNNPPPDTQKEMIEYDVIIIGAGPGGLNCAKILSQNNFKILVIEKNRIIGPKVCAGGLLNHTQCYLNLPEELIENRFDEITFSTPTRKKTLKLDHNNTIFTINRETLSQWQMEQLDKSRVSILKETKVTEINSDHVIVNNSQKIFFKYLVGADGSNSITRKHLGLNKERKGLGLQYIIPTDKYRDLEIHFDSSLFYSWYAWIFPHRNYVSIGTVGSPDHIPAKRIKKNLLEWLKAENIDYSCGEFQAFPINSDFKGFQFENIFLIGDAAGLASEFSGEGIYQALVSGEEAAKKIMDKKYEPVNLKALLSKKRLHLRLSLCLEKSDRARNILFEVFILSLKNRYLSNAGMRYFA